MDFLCTLLLARPQAQIQHLEKAAQMAMNMNLLLQQETKVLRAENERKLKKKARKRASLGNDLFIFVQEGCDRIQQVGEQVDEQVGEPTPISCQCAPPRCSGCWTIGHTRRSCPKK
jgi:hypothetical protein